jgi:CRP/FNR family transcriptional regulator
MTHEFDRSAVDATSFGQRIADTLQLIQNTMPVQRRMVHAGDAIYQVGQEFGSLYVVNSGLVKMVNLTGPRPWQSVDFVRIRFRYA